ncbi:glycosyltransferase family 2 protein [Campylobacter sp. 1569]|uniref:glycosyltransferase family 2 protein n=1 Tax=Campylobacter sp. 1569 TaxID=2735746 RepID=UPI00301C5228|nr:glycosyltransferase [Campylobacter sp. 1569]
MKISILMPCYNSSKYLDRSITSVLKQDYKNWELICIDDGSTDDTYNLLINFANQDSRIKVFKKNNSGMAAPALNLALKHVTGDFIFLLGHDDEINDVLLSDFISRYNELTLQNYSIDAIIPRSLIFFPENQDKNYMYCGIKNIPNSEDKILTGTEAFKLSIDWDIATFAFYRTDIVKKLGFYEEGISGDEYSVREFLLNSKKIAFAKNGIYIYHQIDESITHKLKPKKFNIHKTLYMVEKLAKKWKLDSKTIRKINQLRIKQFYNMQEEYLINKNNLSKQEQELIEMYLNENLNLIKPYRIFIDYFIRKEKDAFGKAIVLFHYLKFYYKKLKK